MHKLIAVALMATLAIPTSALADCRRVYAAQAYVAPVYYQNYIDHQNVVLVPKAFAVATPLQSYTSVGDEYRQANFARLVAEEYARIVEGQRQQLQLGPLPQIPPGAQASTAPKTKTIKDVLANRCASCHDGKTTPNAPNLAGDPDKIGELVRLKSFHAVSNGSMPKGKTEIPKDEFNLLDEWVKSATARPSNESPTSKITPGKQSDVGEKK